MSIVADVIKGLEIIAYRLKNHGLVVTAWWASDHLVRRLVGAPIRRVSQITPQLHVGGQYKRRGWRKLESRGVTAVVNMRVEFDDQAAGIAPKEYVHLPTVDDDAPSLTHLRQGICGWRNGSNRGNRGSRGNGRHGCWSVRLCRARLYHTNAQRLNSSIFKCNAQSSLARLVLQRLFSLAKSRSDGRALPKGSADAGPALGNSSAASTASVFTAASVHATVRVYTRPMTVLFVCK